LTSSNEQRVAVRRIVRPLPVAPVLLVSAFAFAGPATAADPPSGAPQAEGAVAPPSDIARPAGVAAPPVKTQEVNGTECTPTNKDGYQLCSSDKGEVQRFDTRGAPLYRLSVTSSRELRRNGAVVYRSEEQHLDLDLTNKPGTPQAQEFLRAGAVLVTDTLTCTYDDRPVFTKNQLRRELSNLTCGPSQ